MTYRLEHLALFEPLTRPDACKGTLYFELHPRELPHAVACWLPGSLFVKDAAFDFFAGCFHTASASFDYFSFQRFGAEEITRLNHALDGYLNGLTHEPTRERLFCGYESVFDADIWSAIDTPALSAAVRRCGETMRTFIRTRTKKSKCLWVLGM